jgi:Doubled CXXCH motif (Paired_CXXCH_1)
VIDAFEDKGRRFEIMRKLGYLIAAAMLLMGGAATAWAQAAPGAGIVDSFHDFTAGHAEASTTDPGASICIFCHVQHRQGAPATAATRLLWNHKPSALSYSWSDETQTAGGTQLPTNINTWDGSTKNCLSCHDGTVAVGDVFRSAAFPSISFTVTGTRITDGKISASFLLIPNATGDLKGNHPVSIPFPFGGAASTYNGITTGSGVDVTDYVASPVNVKLFSDAGGEVIDGGTIGATGIECASCHDVHNKHVKEAPLLRDFFRLDSGSASALCLDCHNK